MNDDDIDESLKEKWSDRLTNYSKPKSFYNKPFFESLSLPILLETNQNILRYQGKFYFVVGKYEQAFKYLTKLLKLESNDPFALRYQGEIHHIMKKYEKSLMNLDKLLEININETSPVDLKELSETNNDIAWILNVYEKVARK